MAQGKGKLTFEGKMELRSRILLLFEKQFKQFPRKKEEDIHLIDEWISNGRRNESTLYEQFRIQRRYNYPIEREQDSATIQDLGKHADRVLIIPSRLREAREKSGWTQGRLADELWTAKEWISICENKSDEEKASVEKALCYVVAVFLGTTPGYLMGQTDSFDKDLYIERYRVQTETGDQLEEVQISELSTPIFFSAKTVGQGFNSISKLKNELAERMNPTTHDDELCKLLITYMRHIFGHWIGIHKWL